MERLLISIVAFNRPAALSRLLNSLKNLTIPNDNYVIHLLISIDGGGTNSSEVEKISQEFSFNHGTKEVRLIKENLGLKKHVLSCFADSLHYDYLLLLEEDLVLSKNALKYIKLALSSIDSDEKVFGCSLYSPKINETSRYLFEPIYDGYDNFYLKVPCSWGGVYSSSNVADFLQWMQHPNLNLNLPSNVIRWSDKSWKKYMYSYITFKDKYFFYPRVSFSTTLCDQGEHHTGSDLLITPLSFNQTCSNFSSLSESKSVYDEYCEIEPFVIKSLCTKLASLNFTVDFNGYKKYLNNDDLVLTRGIFCNNKENYTYTNLAWADDILPLEQNCIHDLSGKEISLVRHCDRGFIHFIALRLYILWKYSRLRFCFPLLFRLLGKG